MPVLLQIILVVIPCVAIVLAGRWLLRRRLSAEELDHAERAVPFLLGTVGGFFGLLAGFMLSNSWAELNGLRSTMTAEMNALADLANIAAQLPQPQAGELRGTVGAYLHAVVYDELPAMEHGRVSRAPTQAISGMWAQLARYQPKTGWEGTLRGLATNKVMELGEKRRQRLDYGRERFPFLLWWILLGSGTVVVAGAMIVSLKYRRPAGAFLGALVAVVALVLFSIHVVGHPFQYGFAMKAHDYVAHWEQLGGPQPVAP